MYGEDLVLRVLKYLIIRSYQSHMLMGFKLQFLGGLGLPKSTLDTQSVCGTPGYAWGCAPSL